MECGISESIRINRTTGGERGGTGSGSGVANSSDVASRSTSAVIQRRQQQLQPFLMHHSADVHGGHDIADTDGRNLVGTDGGATSDPTQAVLPISGTVTQVCRKWGVYEDEVYAYKLQEKEIEMHYGKNRENRHLVRSDLKQAKDLQMVESTEANSHERAAQSLEFHDEMLARRLQQELEGEVSAKIKSLEMADKEMAEHLQRMECRRDADNGGFDKRLHKPQKPRMSASSTSTSLHRSSGRHEYRPIPIEKHDIAAEHQHASSRGTQKPFIGCENSVDRPRPQMEMSAQTLPHSPLRRIAEVTAAIAQSPRPLFASKSVATDEDDEETMRLMQEEEDARLAQLLQEEESLKKSRDYRDQQLAIEAQDRELAKLLQEQERSKARRARHKYHKPRSTDALQSADPSEHHAQKDEDKRSPSVTARHFQPLLHNDTQEASSSSLRLETGARPVRPTKLPVSSAYSHEPRLEPAPRRRDVHLSRSPQSDNGNVATVIDPTYRRSHSKQKHHQDVSSASPVLPTPLLTQSGSIEGLYPLEGDEEYDQLEDDHAPPYMPIQGQKRLPSIEKRKKKDSCKQQ